MEFTSVEDVQKRLENAKYICSKEIATVIFLAGATQKPILVEGKSRGPKPRQGADPAAVLRGTG